MGCRIARDLRGKGGAAADEFLWYRSWLTTPTIEDKLLPMILTTIGYSTNLRYVYELACFVEFYFPSVAYLPICPVLDLSPYAKSCFKAAEMATYIT